MQQLVVALLKATNSAAAVGQTEAMGQLHRVGDGSEATAAAAAGWRLQVCSSPPTSTRGTLISMKSGSRVR